MRIVRENFAGVEQVLRIEDLFYLREDIVQRAVLLADEGRTRQAHAVFTADRSAALEHEAIQIAGDRLELPGRLGSGRRQKGPQVHLPGRRVRIERRRYAVL